MIRNNGRIYKKENSTRKNNKQMMEKRRRARINTCLTELKLLVLKGMKKEEAEFSKLEKADILELTVNYLNNRKNEQKTTRSCEDENIARYRAGFNECAKEAFKYIGTSPHVTDETRLRVTEHLASFLQTKQEVGLPSAKKKIARLPPAPVEMKHLTPFPMSVCQPSPVCSSPATTPIVPCPHSERISCKAYDTTAYSYVNIQSTILEDIRFPTTHGNAYVPNFQMSEIKGEPFTDFDNESVHKAMDSPQTDTMWRPW